MLYFQWNGGNDEYDCTPTNIIYDFAYTGMRKITVSYRDVNSSVYSSLIRKFEEKFGVTGITDDMPEADLKRTLFKTEKVYINLGYFTDSQSISLSFLDPTEYSFSD